MLTMAGGIPPGTPARMATTQQLVADMFFGIDYSHGDPRIHLGGTFWKAGVVHYLAPDETMPEDRFGRRRVIPAGSLIRRTGHGDNWSADLCTSKRTVTVIGVQSHLLPELDIQAGWAGHEGGYDRLYDILRPDDGRSPFCASAIVSGGSDRLPALPADTLLAVLDGATAIRWLAEIRTPIVVALIDRSSADQSAAMTVLQSRSTSEPVEVAALGWAPIAGMEALAFEAKV